MEEPNALIRWVIYLFAGGDAGRLAVITITALIARIALPHRIPRPASKVVGVLLLMGLLVFVCSPLPVPSWFMILTFVWLIAVVWTFRIRLRLQEPLNESVKTNPQWSVVGKIQLIGCAVWLLLCCCFELPYLRFVPPSHDISEILVIGDSVTAGLNEGEDTWPQKVARDAAVNVFDASQPGATLKSARGQNKLFADRPGLVILEIGGNDLLEGLPVAAFEQELNQLLTEVTQAGRSVVMFELPLPPFSRGYGWAQRRQALRHGVSLIPKRQFANVLTTTGATVDGIHLSSQGQTLIAQLIRTLFHDQLKPGVGRSTRLEAKFMGAR